MLVCRLRTILCVIVFVHMLFSTNIVLGEILISAIPETVDLETNDVGYFNHTLSSETNQNLEFADNGDYPALLCLHYKEIRKLDLASKKYIFERKIELGQAIDYHYVKNIIVWSDSKDQKIYSAPLGNRGPITTLVEHVVSRSVAVDWVHNNVYWSDTSNKTIRMAQLNGQYSKTIHSNYSELLWGIVLHPLKGWVFWADNEKIERSDLNGTHREVIVSMNNSLPRGLAIDFDSRKIYWADETGLIGSADYDGSNQRIIMQSGIITGDIFSLDVFEDWLYWTAHDTLTRYVGKTNKLSGENVTKVVEGDEWSTLSRLKVYHSSKQPQVLQGSTSGTTEQLSSTPRWIVSTMPSCDCGVKSSGCFFDNHGAKQCVCLTGYAQIGDMCSDCCCGKNSLSCKFDYHGNKNCTCKLGYAQKNGICTETCRSDSNCLNGGICRRQGDVNFCVCHSSYSGERCETDDICEAMKAKCDFVGAVCKRIGMDGVCECPPEKTYNLNKGMCEDICHPSICFRGKCEICGKSYKCICDEGFTGIHCTETHGNKCEFYSLMMSGFIVMCIASIFFTTGAMCFICRSRKFK